MGDARACVQKELNLHTLPLYHSRAPRVTPWALFSQATTSNISSYPTMARAGHAQPCHAPPVFPSFSCKTQTPPTPPAPRIQSPEILIHVHNVWTTLQCKTFTSSLIPTRGARLQQCNPDQGLVFSENVHGTTVPFEGYSL